MLSLNLSRRDPFSIVFALIFLTVLLSKPNFKLAFLLPLFFIEQSLSFSGLLLFTWLLVKFFSHLNYLASIALEFQFV